MQRRKYSTEFKREAVELTRDPGVTITQVARELGINPNMLGRWRKEFEGQGGAPCQGCLVVLPNQNCLFDYIREMLLEPFISLFTIVSRRVIALYNGRQLLSFVSISYVVKGIWALCREFLIPILKAVNMNPDDPQTILPRFSYFVINPSSFGRVRSD